jgi:hypothetical protein
MIIGKNDSLEKTSSFLKRRGAEITVAIDLAKIKNQNQTFYQLLEIYKPNLIIAEGEAADFLLNKSMKISNKIIAINPPLYNITEVSSNSIILFDTDAIFTKGNLIKNIHSNYPIKMYQYPSLTEALKTHWITKEDIFSLALEWYSNKMISF